MYFSLEAISSPALIQLLETTRVTFSDLSYLENDSGTSLLHEAARRQDPCLIELTVRAGADVFIRNRNSTMGHEGAVMIDDHASVSETMYITTTCQWISLFSR